jgi:hypothetical protein
MTVARAATLADVDEVVRLATVMFDSMGVDHREPSWRGNAHEALVRRLGDDLAVFVVDRDGGGLVASGAGTIAERLPTQPDGTRRLHPVGGHRSGRAATRLRTRGHDRAARLVRDARRDRRRAARDAGRRAALSRARLLGGQRVTVDAPRDVGPRAALIEMAARSR